MKKILPLFSFALILTFGKTNAQGVGINATGALPNAAAMLHVDAGTNGTKGFLVTGTLGGSVPDLGAGSRLMFYPGKAAFRAGNVSGTQWDNINVGTYSAALGNNTIASGNNSIAMGNGTNATGNFSTAMGTGTTASNTASTALGAITIADGLYSTAMGLQSNASGQTSLATGTQTSASGLSSTAMGNASIASGNNATAMGSFTMASGNTSTAMGNNTVASGGNSTAIGNITTASATNSTAIGSNTVASGPNSTAMGNSVSTNFRDGSFVIGDNSLVAPMTSSADNQMSMRFAGGYRLFSNLTGSTGVTLAPGGGSWSTVSDKHKKENFYALDAESILKKVAALPLKGWNYKSQPASQKHVGPMAQDFYTAFGLDGMCNNTTINTGDIDGINMVAIQGLEKRTADLKTSLAAIDEVKKENELLRQSLAQMQLQLLEQQKLITQTVTQLNTLAGKGTVVGTIVKK